MDTDTRIAQIRQRRQDLEGEIAELRQEYLALEDELSDLLHPDGIEASPAQDQSEAQEQDSL